MPPQSSNPATDERARSAAVAAAIKASYLPTLTAKADVTCESNIVSLYHYIAEERTRDHCESIGLECVSLLPAHPNRAR